MFQLLNPQVVGTGAAQQIIKAAPATAVAGQAGMSGIQALAAAAAATSKITTSTSGSTLTTASGQQIRVSENE